MNLDLSLLAVLSSVVVALVQALRQIPWLSARSWALPLLSLACGIGAAFVWILGSPPELSPCNLVCYCLAHGIAAGLSASGFYSLAVRPAAGGVSAILGKTTDNDTHSDGPPPAV